LSYKFLRDCSTMEIVECRSGFAYAERPIALTWDRQRLEVESILASWRTPGERRFRVRTRDLRTFELAWREADDEWQILPVEEK
jgi:hypothetical protein